MRKLGGGGEGSLVGGEDGRPSNHDRQAIDTNPVMIATVADITRGYIALS